MNCKNCFDLCERTFDDLLGTVDLPEDEPIELIIEHIGSGRIEVQQSTVGAGGEVEIDLLDPFIQDGESYRVQVVTGYSSDPVMIVPEGSVEYSCVTFTYAIVC